MEVKQMSNIVMLKRAFNQAIATGSVRFTDKETDFLVIKRFMIDYAAKNNVDIAVSEIESFIKEQQENMVDASTVIVGEGTNIEIENIAVMDKPVQLTKEEMLKEAFNEAAANPAVNFVDRENDILVIKNAMKQYGEQNGNPFTSEEIEGYIKSQEASWNTTATEIFADGSHVEIGHVSDFYKAEPLTKEQVLADGFAEAAANPAVRFVDTDIDFLVIKKIMMEYAKRWNMEVTEDEIVAYMKDQFHKMHLASQDFSHNFNAMK